MKSSTLTVAERVSHDHWVSGTVGNSDGNYTWRFSAKMFDNPSQLGIPIHGTDGGRVSKLSIKSMNDLVVNYERGWDIEPEGEEVTAVYNAIMKALDPVLIRPIYRNKMFHA